MTTKPTYKDTAEFHPVDGKKPVAYEDMPASQKRAVSKHAAQQETNKHGADDPYPDGPVVMEGVEVIEDHSDVNTEGL